jgi:hypothetical protein
MRSLKAILIFSAIISSCQTKTALDSIKDSSIILYAKRDAPVGGIWLKLKKDYSCYFGFYGRGKEPFQGTYNIISDTIKLFFHDTLPSSMTTSLLLKKDRLEYIENKGVLEIVENNIDSFIPKWPNYKGLSFHIERLKNEYENTDTIFIDYSFRNESNKHKYLLIKQEMNFPLGMTGLLTNNRNSIVNHASKQFYSSNMYSPEELINFYVKMKPGDTYSGRLNLMNVVDLKKGFSVQKLDKGCYYLTMFSFGLESNEILIKVK